MKIEDFSRIGNQFFRFTYSLEDIWYSSGIFFDHDCSDEHFVAVFPLVVELLEWIKTHVADIRAQSMEKLPDDADLGIFSSCEIVSFSLSEKNGVLLAQINYGSTDGARYACEVGTYLISIIQDKKVCSVQLNTA